MKSSKSTCCINCYADEPQIGTSNPKCALNGRCPCHSQKESTELPHGWQWGPESKEKMIPLATLHTLEASLEKMKENLVVDNWDDGKAKTCNPRCHDSGREDAIDSVLQELRKMYE